MGEQRKTLMPGWEYEVVGRGTFITLVGHRRDMPASLPLVVATGRNEEEGVEKLRDRAAEWDDDDIPF